LIAGPETAMIKMDTDSPEGVGTDRAANAVARVISHIHA